MSGSSAAAGLARRLAPLLDRVVVFRAARETRTASGVLLPDTASGGAGAVREGVVVALGPGRPAPTDADPTRRVGVSTELSVGDRVLLPEYGGMSLGTTTEGAAGDGAAAAAAGSSRGELLLFEGGDILARVMPEGGK